MTNRVHIRKLLTGVPGLDTVLGGGLPEFSFNLIAGGPGCGKTTLAHQFMFANASAMQKALYFTIFGEPPIKMLRYQQQFAFFDASKVGDVIRFVHLGQEMIEGGMGKVLERITREIEATDARTIIVDSFRSVARTANALERRADQLDLESFVQLLALTLTSYEATTFLVGEYMEQETNSNPVFTVADGIVWLYQTVVRNSGARRIQVVKMRGQATVPGMHTVKLSDRGMLVFPRLPAPEVRRPPESPRTSRARKKTGIDGLDEILGGGIPAGSSMLVVGPAGAGKTTLATQFVLEGVRAGENAVIATFERRPEDYVGGGGTASDLLAPIAEKKVEIVYVRPHDLSVDEALADLQEAVTRLGAKRVVIDSLSGFELALAPAFRDDSRESLYRMVDALKNLGATVILNAEIVDSFTELRLSPLGISFLTDGIILQRYVEREGRVTKAMAVLKLRGSDHGKELHAYEVTARGIVVGEALGAYRGVLTGVAVPIAPRAESAAKPPKSPAKKTAKKTASPKKTARKAKRRAR